MYYIIYTQKAKKKISIKLTKRERKGAGGGRGRRRVFFFLVFFIFILCRYLGTSQIILLLKKHVGVKREKIQFFEHVWKKKEF
jgi:hypothetical protein